MLRLMLACSLLVVTGCTSTVKMANGRYAMAVSAEERSPFGTNVGFSKLMSCEKADTYTQQPFTPDYINCYDLTDWVPVSSQGQGGQITAGALQMIGLFGLGALIPGGGTQSINQSVTTIVPAAPHKGH